MWEATRLSGARPRTGYDGTKAEYFCLPGIDLEIVRLPHQVSVVQRQLLPPQGMNAPVNHAGISTLTRASYQPLRGLLVRCGITAYPSDFVLRPFVSII
jgi:hypothetical protein